MQKFRSLGYGLVFFAGSAVAGQYVQESLPTKKISFCGHSYLAWVAKTEEDRTRGLMNFRELKSGEAMIFEFAEPQNLSFWMKNVAYDLDIVYFSAQKKLVSQTTMKATSPLMKPESLPSYPSRGEAQYAVEVKAGTLKKLPKNCRLVF